MALARTYTTACQHNPTRHPATDTMSTEPHVMAARTTAQHDRAHPTAGSLHTPDHTVTVPTRLPMTPTTHTTTHRDHAHPATGTTPTEPHVSTACTAPHAMPVLTRPLLPHRPHHA
jgi:hypothetical protein